MKDIKTLCDQIRAPGTTSGSSTLRSTATEDGRVASGGPQEASSNKLFSTALCALCG
jgi:hypothetical protein